MMTTIGTHDGIFVDGEWTASTGTERIEVVSPFTEKILGSVPAATREDVDRAIAAARRAFDDGRWSGTLPAERATILRTVRELIAENREDLATLVTDEMGCPIGQSGPIQVGGAMALIDAYLEEAEIFPFRSVRRSATGSALVTREPVGVVAAVVPWNVPLIVALQKLTPALLTGCTVVLKPAPETPLSTYALTELFRRAGVPAGVINVVPADREVSEHLVSHPGVDKVAFTGSTAAGRRIAELCGRNLTRTTLELGGKSAAVVLDDADLDLTVEALRLGSLRNSGQICSLKTRLLVSRRRHDDFIDRLITLIASMPVGDPQDPTTQIGPMVTATQRDRVTSYIEIGKAEGAVVAVGGKDPAATHGWFVDPTIFTHATPEMRIAREEIFGPVLTVLPYDDEDEAVTFANDSDYGLNGAVFTQDVDHGLAVAARIRTGTVEINGNSAGFRAPMGGFKSSGIGREAGAEGLEAYVEPKSYGLPENHPVVVSTAGR